MDLGTNKIGCKLVVKCMTVLISKIDGKGLLYRNEIRNLNRSFYIELKNSLFVQRILVINFNIELYTTHFTRNFEKNVFKFENLVMTMYSYFNTSVAGFMFHSRQT